MQQLFIDIEGLKKRFRFGVFAFFTLLASCGGDTSKKDSDITVIPDNGADFHEVEVEPMPVPFELTEDVDATPFPTTLPTSLPVPTLSPTSIPTSTAEPTAIPLPTLIPEYTSTQLPEPDADDSPSSRVELTPVNQFNYILGTQSISPGYKFTGDSKLIETAKRIKEMGSNLLKIGLDPYLYDDLSQYNNMQYQFLNIVKEIPDFKEVLDMDFAYYLLWVEDSGAWTDDLGFSEEEASLHYKKMYDLTEYLLETYNGTGKTFMLGNWEGDWQMVFNGSVWDDSIIEVNPDRVQAMIDWLNVRQKAVDDAKLNIPHSNVEIFHYVEVNRVLSSMEGKQRITNMVLPHTNVDFVSYSAYDITTLEENADIERLRLQMTNALDFIERHLPEKSGLPFEKRVFIGEYGFASYWWTWDWGDERHTLQSKLSKQVVEVALDWGTPLILYWQMYDNEYDNSVGSYKGYWLISNEDIKLPLYFEHQRFYNDAKNWVEAFNEENNRMPTEQEFRHQAKKILWPQTEEEDSDPESISLWFIGDSITYGLTTLPFNSQGFRVQLWNDIEQLTRAQRFGFGRDEIEGRLQYKYKGIPLKTVGTVSGPSREGDIAHQAKAYFHSGISGATVADIQCLLDINSDIPAGYRFENCEESLANFNYTEGLLCTANESNGGWLSDSSCSDHLEISNSGKIIVPIQLGTNDITFLNVNGAINCSVEQSQADVSGRRLKDVVDSLLDANNLKNSSTLVGKLIRFFNHKGIEDTDISFLVSKIPRRSRLDGQDPFNYCTDYYNNLIEEQVRDLNRPNILVIEQGNLRVSEDPVHPSNIGHRNMACNVLFGTALTAEGTCLLPESTPQGGLLKSLEIITF